MAETSAPSSPIAGLILAGGQGRRIGGDKALRLLGGKPLLGHAIARATPQVGPLAISANGPARLADFGLPILADSVPGFAGPLAGILAGMDWAAALGLASIASFPCDAPFFPRDLVSRLAEARRREGAVLACARSGGRRHPVFALWPTELRAALRVALTDDGIRRVADWCARYPVATVDFPMAPFDPFFNVNTPNDLAEAETLLAAHRSA